MKFIAIVATFASLSIIPMVAAAQTAPAASAPVRLVGSTPARPVSAPVAQPATPEADEPEYVVVHEGGHTFYRLRPGGPVYGEPQRPYAFAVTGRSPLGYTTLEDSRTFLPAVTAAVRVDPF